MASTNTQTFSGDVEIASNLTVDTNTFHVDTVAGRIGIGKTNPVVAVDVSGIINATSLYAGGSEFQGSPWSSDASDIYYTTGAVGIGTNSPAKTLEVQGTLRVSNVSTGRGSDLLVTRSTTWTQQQKIWASDREANDQFGASVSISSNGSTALVGARYEDAGDLNDAGSAYIFTRSSGIWSEQQKITASDKAANDIFGSAVAISGDGNTAIVGAYGDDTQTGSAYIFTNSGGSWSEQQKITASDKATADYFGWSVAISSDGNTALVGAYAEDPDGAYNAGSAYIFTRSGGSWSEQQKITASDKALDDAFGSAVAISSDGNTALVGAWKDDLNAGAAYILTRSGSSWSEQQKLTASDRASSDNFGRGVAISGDGTTALVGAHADNGVAGIQSGSAYIFTYSGGSWGQQTKLLASDAQVYDWFGYSVSLSSDGNTAIVGAHNDDIDGAYDNTGTAYIFTRSGGSWSQQQKIANPEATTSHDNFGWSVAISGDGATALVGVVYEDPEGSITNAGSAYIFALPDYLSSTTPITTAGTILSFTGQHMCFPDGPMGQGQIVSANKNKYISLNGPLTTGARAINSSESLPVVCLSNVANDKNVFGVVDRHEQGGTKRLQESGIGKVTQEKEWGDNRVIVNSIGEGAMWVANTNGNLVSGDYITSSNVAGYGQKQDDDTVHSYTVAKITMDCDFEPEDHPVQVIKKDAQGNNVLDTYGRIQWEDTDRTEKAYRIRYLTTEGQRTDQANAVWTAAYVGCTYHCG
jgi:hypothetical protein